MSRRRFSFFLPSLAVIVSPQRSLRCLLSKPGGRSGRTVTARVPILNPYFQLSRSSCNVYSPAAAAAAAAAHAGTQRRKRTDETEKTRRRQFHDSFYVRKRLSCEVKNVKCRSFILFSFLTMPGCKVMGLTSVSGDSKI